MESAFLATRLLSVLALLLAWQTVATLAPSRTLPPPGDVAFFILREFQSGEMPTQIGATLARVLAAFTLAMAVGSALGIALGRSRRLDRALDLWLLVLLNTPALVVAVLCYLWLGLNEVAAVAAVALNKLPNVAVTLREGARALDTGLDEMARAYRFSRGTWIRHVLLPQLEPHLAAASRSGLAIVWKVVLVVELLGRPNGVGYAISYYFQLFDVRAVLGYSLAFSAVMLVVEYGALQPLEAHARRWRPAAA